MYCEDPVFLSGFKQHKQHKGVTTKEIHEQVETWSAFYERILNTYFVRLDLIVSNGFERFIHYFRYN